MSGAGTMTGPLAVSPLLPAEREDELARLMPRARPYDPEPALAWIAEIEPAGLGLAAHLRRTGLVARRLAEEIAPELAEDLELAGAFHDIGKLLVPQALLSAPALEAGDRLRLRAHTVLAPVLLSRSRLPKRVLDWIGLHHERWNGSGYPAGLRRRSIRPAVTLLSIADVYDAMTSDRPYRRALPHEVAIAKVERGSGSEFDPSIAPRAAELLRAIAREGSCA